MERLINAVFENGVFRPTQDVQVREHEKVTIKIVSHDDWQRRFDCIIEKIHQKAAHFSADEIEADIVTAIKKVREDKNEH
jgi:predicted DNA-binding antitoxin AbrB/MazE fold protein